MVRYFTLEPSQAGVSIAKPLDIAPGTPPDEALPVIVDHLRQRYDGRPGTHELVVSYNAALRGLLHAHEVRGEAVWRDGVITIYDSDKLLNVEAVLDEDGLRLVPSTRPKA